MSKLKRQRSNRAGHDLATAAIDGIQDASLPDLAQDNEPKPQACRSLFVRELPASATTETLIRLFSQSYPVKHATIVSDKTTNRSKGFGFITFADIEDAENAQKEFNGVSFDGNNIKIEAARPRHRQKVGDRLGASASAVEAPRKRQLTPLRRLIIRNLPWTIRNEEHLGKLLVKYGKVTHLNMPQRAAGLSAGFGFVTFQDHRNAERALQTLNGEMVNGRTLAVDWAVEKEVWEDLQRLDEGQVEWHRSDGSLEAGAKAETNHCQVPVNDGGSDRGIDHEDREESVHGHNGEDEVVDLKHAPAPHQQSTIFVRNIPFSVTDESLFEHFSSFGVVRYAKVVVDQATKCSKGTGFVRFRNVEDAKSCLQEAVRLRQSTLQGATLRGSNTSSLKQSVLEDTALDRTGCFTLEGRVLQICSAVDRSEAARLSFANTNLRHARDRDLRRLYLLSEGTVLSNSSLYEKLSPSEVRMREESAKQRQTLIRANPSLHLSLTRLSIRNIPRFMTSKDLKLLAREAVVGFAKDVSTGYRKPLSKEEASRGGEEMRSAERARRAKGNGIVKQAKIIFESRDGGKVAEEGGAQRSRGYGFVEYSSHRWALMGLRWLNGRAVGLPEATLNSRHPTLAVPERKRLIVEFAVENAQVVLWRQQRESKALEKSKRSFEEQKNGRVLEENKRRVEHLSPVNTRRGTKRQRSSGSRYQEASKREALDEDSVHAERRAKRQKIIGRRRTCRKVRHGSKSS